jgi:hypothetical protein
MVKWLGPEACKDLAEKEKVTFGDYEITYWPGKLFKVQKGKYKNLFYDINNFIQGKLEETAPKYLNKQKIPSEIKPEVCIQHAKLCAELGNKILECLDTMGIRTNSLISPVSVFKKSFLETLDLPTHDDLPIEVAELAYDCCDGEWVEAFKIGYFPKVYSYDITSAYPSEMMWLPDHRYGKWVQSDKWVEGTKLAYLNGNVCIEKDYSPVVFRDDYNYGAVGMWEKAITGRMWAFIKEFGLGSYEIRDGWWWIPEKKVYPFQKLVLDVYRWKKQGGLMGLLCKMMMAGAWGLFGQIYDGTDGQEDELGEYFNSVFVAEVTNNVKLKVARQIHSRNLNPVHIAVDQLLLENQCPEMVGNGKIGDWKYEGEMAAVVIGSQTLAMENRKYLGLDFNEIKNLLGSQPTARKYRMAWNAPFLLSKANSHESLGRFRPLERIIDIQYESKRNFPVKPKNGSELLSGTFESVPWDTVSIAGCGSGREKHYLEENEE